MPRRSIRLLTATALCAASAAHAQQADGPVLLDRIVPGFGPPCVTIDTPQAVTALGQEDIDRHQPATTAELLDGVPGVQAVGPDRPAGVSFNIRGTGESLSSDESRIVATVDGATKFYEQYRVGSFFGDPEPYGRAEVLRGPASSTLVGAGASGGAIAFETRDAADVLGPDTDNALRFRLGATSNGAGGSGTVTYAGRLSERAELLAWLTYRQADAYEDGGGETVDGSAFDSFAGLLESTFRLPQERAQTAPAARRNSAPGASICASTLRVGQAEPWRRHADPRPWGRPGPALARGRHPPRRAGGGDAIAPKIAAIR
jgi:hemoglobin/transferrin/lactoferrin receptor protein